jgi:hypothetical protein
MPPAYPWLLAPTNTPVLLPRRAAASSFARSKASQVVSSRSRCCGSIATASRGEMPKNAGSNCAASVRKQPSRT